MILNIQKLPDNRRTGRLSVWQNTEHSNPASLWFCAECLHRPALFPGVTPSAAFSGSDGPRGKTVTVMWRVPAHSIPCFRAPSPARMKEISLESTMWCAPSCRTNRSPESLWPDRGPFSQASKNPCEWMYTTSGVSGFRLQMHYQEPPNILVFRSLTFLCRQYFTPQKKKALRSGTALLFKFYYCGI